jgi:hypothetical protein
MGNQIIRGANGYAGEISLFGTALLERIKESIGNTIFEVNADKRVIAFSRLTDQPRVCGAGMYAVESFFSDPFGGVA